MVTVKLVFLKNVIQNFQNSKIMSNNVKLKTVGTFFIFDRSNVS